MSDIVDPFTGPPVSEVDEWRHGKCYPMAVALHELTGAPIAILYSKRGPRDPRWHPVHMMVELEEGVMDAGGIASRQDVFDEYLPASPPNAKAVNGPTPREYARQVGFWEVARDLAEFKELLVREEGAEFFEKNAWPWIESQLPAAREFVQKYMPEISHATAKVPSPA